MADFRMAAQTVLDKYDVENRDDVLRELMAVLVNALMDGEVTAQIGAERYERTRTRTNRRNGRRRRRWDSRVGTLELEIPKLREGSYYPSFLEPRRRSEQALLAVIQEAYVSGVSTRKVERLVRQLGIENISKSQVSRICSELDEMVEAWRTRQLEEPIPYLWLDATFPKVREDRRVSGMGLALATGVEIGSHRRNLGLDIGATESYAFWKQFLRSLKERGLRGVLVVISDDHPGLRQAVEEELVGATWQRCRVHFLRNVLGRVKKADADYVCNRVKSIFAQKSAEEARRQLHAVAEELEERFPDISAMLEEAEPHLLAYSAFPIEHWRKIWSTNPLERQIREVKRRTDVVGIFPNRAAVIRLVGACLQEQDEDCVSGRRYISATSLAALYETPHDREENAERIPQ